MLVAAAGRHGAAGRIADTVAERLLRVGLTPVTADAEDVHALEGWDAVVLGSGLDGGRWLDPARRVVHELAHELRRRPVWLFSSASAEALAAAGCDPGPLVDATGARGHAVLPARIDRPGWAEAARGRDVVAAWADGIARDLRGDVPG